MNWQNKLKQYEHIKDWESAIQLLYKTIINNPYNLDAYLSINYLLMYILVETDYTKDKHNFYAKLLKKLFLESYAKFSTNPEYLFFIGKIACMSEWYFGIELEEAENMIRKASMLDSGNLLYKWSNFSGLDMRIPNNKEKMILYAKEALSDRKLKDLLLRKGALGKHLLNILKYWSKETSVLS